MLYQMDWYLKRNESVQENFEKDALPFGSVTSWSRFTNVLNLSPRKLSGVLRDADNEEAETGLELMAFEFIPLGTVGYSKPPPFVPPIPKPAFDGEVEPVVEISHGFDDACSC